MNIHGLANPFEIRFPLFDNNNLTDFLNEYNSLNPYKAK